MTDQSNKPGALVGPGKATGGALARSDAVTPLARQEVARHQLGGPSWSAASAHAELLLAMRRRRKRGVLLRLAAFVGLPTLLTAAYFLLVASPRYGTEFELTYQTYQPTSSLAAGLVQSVVGTSQGNTVDLGAIVYQYIRSAALLRQLDGELQLRAAFSDPGVDWVSRMDPRASEEKFLQYYRWHVAVSEGLGGYLTVTVETFDPHLSLALARAVARACDAMVDQMTARARQDELAFAQSEVTREEDRVRRARMALAAFQDEHRDLDPERMATQVSGIVGTLEADLAAARTQLAQTSPFLGANSPIVVQIKTRIASLEEQLRRQQSRLAGPEGTPFSQVLASYARLQLDEEFARTAYGAAEQGLAVARADAVRKQNYLVDFVTPVLPDRASLQTPITVIASVFLGSLLALGVVSLLAGALRDQSGA